MLFSTHLIWKSTIWKTFLAINNYPPNLTDSYIKSFLNKLYAPKVIVHNVPERNVFAKYLCWEMLRFKFEKKLQKLFTDELTSCNIKILFKSPVRVKTFFIFKDKLPKILLSRLVYK